jgi:hypothetical protein
MAKKEPPTKNVAPDSKSNDIRWNRQLWFQMVICCILMQLGFIITLYRIPQIVTYKVSLLVLILLYLLIGFRYARLKMVYASRKGYPGTLWMGLGIACGVGFLVLLLLAHYKAYNVWLWLGLSLALLGECFLFLVLQLLTEKPAEAKNLPPLWEEKLAFRLGITTEEKIYQAWPRWIWIGCFVVVLIAALHSASKSVGGGDTWVAMACGRYTLDSPAKDQPNRTWQMKSLDTLGIHTTQKEPLGARTREFNPESTKFKTIMNRSWGTIKKAIKDAFASEKEKELRKEETVKAYDPELDNVGWVNQNWLTHVLFYKMKTAYDGDEYKSQKGEILIVLYKFIQAILTALFMYWAARVLGAHPLLAASAVAFGILLSRSFIDLRPNVSSIFFAAIMILLVSYWKKGRHWALAGMIPVMILWSNVHGGFIYAIMIFFILLTGHAVQNYARKINYAFLLLGLLIVTIFFFNGAGKLQEDWKIAEKQRKNTEQHILRQGNLLSDTELKAYSNQLKMFTRNADTLRAYQVAGVVSALALIGIAVFSLFHFSKIQTESFYQTGKRGLIFLAAASGIVFLFPAIFSPFGFENLAHPLIIALGEEGKQWREVIEWKPIWDMLGFGNAGPYQYFLLCFGLVVLAWFIFYFLKPTLPELIHARRKKQKPKEQFHWPKIDLAQISIITVTLAMSVKSRRFIPLAGVVLAPFLAAMLQEIIYMVRIVRAHQQKQPLQILPKRNLILATATWLIFVPVGLIGWEFHQYMDETYQYKDVIHKKTPPQSMFRRMVGIGAQPVYAMEFFHKYQFQGVMFNEWTHGGFVSFHQTPIPETGEPPCKVFMDGRAQAAYTLAHYKYWSGISQNARQSSVSAKAFSQKLRQENINMAVLDVAEITMGNQVREKGKPAYDKLIQSGDWVLLFHNNRYAVLAAIEETQNQEKIRQALQDDFRSLMLSTCATPQALKHVFADQWETLQQCYLKHPNVLAEPFIEVKQGRKNLLYNPQALHILFQGHSQELKAIFLKHTNILRWFIINQFPALEEIFQDDAQFLNILRNDKQIFNKTLRKK